jgi:hypothetical protein
MFALTPKRLASRHGRGIFAPVRGNRQGEHSHMVALVNPATIFLPVLAVVALTFVGLVRMGMGRAAAIRGGHPPRYYRAQIGEPEPEATVVAVRHWSNLFELPTLFYAACVVAYVLNAVNGVVLGLAWAYVAARLVQSAVHLTYNNPAHRGLAFMIGAFCVFALWVVMGLAIFARV